MSIWEQAQRDLDLRCAGSHMETQHKHTDVSQQCRYRLERSDGPGAQWLP